LSDGPLSFISFKVSVLFTFVIFTSIACSKAENLEAPFIKSDNIDVLRHLKVLSSDKFAGRKFASPASLQSQSYLVDTLKELAVPAFKNSYRHSFKKTDIFQTKQGTNIIAYVPGTDHADEYIILSAHYDHLGAKRGKVFNGADDNASGTAALLHYAKLIKQQPLKYSVIFLFTDGEEINLLGAKAFIAQQDKLRKQFKLNINLDMIAGSKQTKKLRFISRDLEKLLSEEGIERFNHLQAQFKNDSTVRLTPGFRNASGAGSSLKRTNWRMASDHGIFSRAGLPFIYFGVGPHRNYHTEFDDYEHINHSFYLAATTIIFKQIIYLDKAISENSYKLSAKEKNKEAHL